MSETKQCLACGKEFKPCNTCIKTIDEMYQWRRVVCCMEHFNYHMPIIQYTRGQISKAEAKETLTQAINNFGEIEFADNVKAIANEILAEEKKSSKKSSKVIETEPVVTDEVSEATEDYNLEF